MAKITDIIPQKKNKSRYNLFVDGEFFTGTSHFIIQKHRLTIGSEINKEKLKIIILEDEVEKAKDYVITYHLNKSKKIIIDKLNEKGYSEKVIEIVIQFLETYQLQDDNEYARKKTMDMLKIGKKGNRVISQTLRQNGVSEENIEKALSSINKEDEIKAAKKAIKGKIENYQKKSKNRYEFKNKCYAFLARKGFSGDIINTVLEELNQEDL